MPDIPGLSQLASIAVKPIEAFSEMASRPTVLRPMDLLRGTGSLEKAVAGKIVVITGASSGIGEATALACVAAGASVALAARREAIVPKDGTTPSTTTPSGGTTTTTPSGGSTTTTTTTTAPTTTAPGGL